MLSTAFLYQPAPLWQQRVLTLSALNRGASPTDTEQRALMPSVFKQRHLPTDTQAHLSPSLSILEFFGFAWFYAFSKGGCLLQISSFEMTKKIVSQMSFHFCCPIVPISRWFSHEEFLSLFSNKTLQTVTELYSCIIFLVSFWYIKILLSPRQPPGAFQNHICWNA